VTYEIICPICDILTRVNVVYESDDSVPEHCPMCGSDVEVEHSEYDDDEWED
jgi:uncharacterized Zn finger protein (UPF0148 family)